MLSQLEMKRGEPGSGREVPARRRLEQEARVRGHTGLRNSTVPKMGGQMAQWIRTPVISQHKGPNSDPSTHSDKPGPWAPLTLTL